MKLSQYAEWAGVTYRTAWEHFRTGKIKGAIRLPTGKIVVPNLACQRPEHTVVYARESSSDRKACLKSQTERLAAFCNAYGWPVDEVVCETGSGLNDSRKKLLRVLREKKATRLVVEHQDRLARFGVEYIRIACQMFGCEIIVIN